MAGFGIDETSDFYAFQSFLMHFLPAFCAKVGRGSD